MMKARSIGGACAGIILAWLASPAFASGTQHDAMDHGNMGTMTSSANEAPSTQAFKQADAAMGQHMSMNYTGDPDVDFVRGMIPHHEGAVAMARVELKYGHDLEMKRFAQRIIDAQQGEVKFMQRWLKAHQQETSQEQ